MRSNLLFSSIIAGACLLSSVGVSNAQTTVLFDDFSGTGSVLNGQAPDVGTGAWSANSPFLDNGTIVGADEGSALLAFEPAVNSQYELTMDVSNTTDRWIALGFARDALISAGASNLNDRFANEPEGIAWMLFRNTASANQDVQVFAGLRTGTSLYSGDPVANFGIAHTLKIAIDTAGTGANFKAQFYVDGVALLAAPATINIAVADINFAGLSYDNATTTPPTFDNFRLVQVPEPTAIAAIAGASLVGLRRRRQA